MAYAYCEGHCKIVGHFVFRLGEEVSEFVAVFERCIAPNGKRNNLTDFLREGKLPSGIAVISEVCQTVLVDVIEILEDGKDGRKYGMPSMVRLFTFDEFLGFLRQGCDSVLLSLEVLRRIANGKLEFSEVIRQSFGTLGGESIDQMIKSASRIVGAISPNDRVAIESSGIVDFKYETVTARLRIELFGDSIRLIVDPAGDFRLESLEVFFSPLYF